MEPVCISVEQMNLQRTRNDPREGHNLEAERQCNTGEHHAIEVSML